MNNRIEIRLDTALYNAGILGLYRLLKEAGGRGGEEFCVREQLIEVDRDFLLGCGLERHYLSLLRKHYGPHDRVQAFANTDYMAAEERAFERLDGYLKNKTPYTVYEMAVTFEGLPECGFPEVAKAVLDTNFAKQPEDKRRLAAELVALLRANPLLYERLLEADIAMNHLKDFFSNFAFLKYGQGNYLINASQSFLDALKSKLTEPLFAQAEGRESKAKRGLTECIQCGSNFGAYGQKAVFLNDFVDDMDKKTSTFWNQRADTFFCPVCNLIYCCVPFGFFPVGPDKMFINVDDSMEALIRSNNGAMENGGDRLRALNAAVLYELENKQRELNNIEVLLRVNRSKRSYYSYYVVAAETLRVLQESKGALERLNPCYFKTSDGYLDVFAECLNNVLEHKNQWLLIRRLLKEGFTNMWKLNNLLQIQVNQNHRGEEGILLNKRVYVASQEGAKLRLVMNDDNNKLRGYTYRLTNALNFGNRDMYMDTVMRMYNGIRAKDGKRLPVPDILLQMFDEDQFSEIGYSYLFGVNGDYKEEDKEKKENGGEETNK